MGDNKDDEAPLTKEDKERVLAGLRRKMEEARKHGAETDSTAERRNIFYDTAADRTAVHPVRKRCGLDLDTDVLRLETRSRQRKPAGVFR